MSVSTFEVERNKLKEEFRKKRLNLVKKAGRRLGGDFDGLMRKILMENEEGIQDQMYNKCLFLKDFFAGENMGWLMGLEPTTTGITIQGSTN